MKSLSVSLVLFMFFFCFGNAFSQTLEGYIYDKKTEAPLQAATVYLDGTTVSALTDENGFFKLNSKGSTKTDLVISYIGYVTSRISNPFQYKKIKTFLEEDAISIEEVVIGKGPFTRKSMMKAFKTQFLGNSKAALSCKILNEEDINFYYDIDTNTLSATSRNPLKIKNSFLAYEVNFELIDFAVEYKARTLDQHYISKSYFAGTTFYKDLSKNNNAKKKRTETYLGSSTHFMYTVAHDAWQKEKFQLYVDKFPVSPSEYFKISDTLEFKKVTLIKEATAKVPKMKLTSTHFTDATKVEATEYEDKKVYFNILFNGKKQSIADFVSKEFIVDQFGNYTPFYNIMFGGYISTLKAGDMLPTDYLKTLKETD